MSIAKFVPMNIQEHEDMLRAIVNSHMGVGGGNPTRWVVEAVAEAFQRGFALGFQTGQLRMQPKLPEYGVQFEPDPTESPKAPRRGIPNLPGLRALPLVERTEEGE